MCPECGSIVDEDILKARNSENTCLICGADLGGNGNSGKKDDESDWITWWYLRDKRFDDDYSLWDKQPKHPDYFEVIKEFKAPPESNPGGLDEVKRILRTYIPDAFAPVKDEGPIIRCPYCGSKEFTLLNKGYSLFTGFLGSGRIKRVCKYCKREF